MNLSRWEARFKEFLIDECNHYHDGAHGLAHIQRVVASSKSLTKLEGADPGIAIPAAWLHDCVIVPKNHPERSGASQLAAEKASYFLHESGYEEQKIKPIHHAICAHSYSAGIQPETLEAKIVQDADRLDALGAIGIARCMMVGGAIGRALYHPDDPFCEKRDPDDQTWTIDHFYEKLFKLPDSMNTESAKTEAHRRVVVMERFLNGMRREITVNDTNNHRMT
jgi:uncharacterized protein